MRIYENIREIENGKGDDCIIDSLPHYPYFKKYYNIIATDLTE